jgi:hypothetical protein
MKPRWREESGLDYGRELRRGEKREGKRLRKREEGG